jgi:HEAT repeat protein
VKTLARVALGLSWLVPAMLADPVVVAARQVGSEVAPRVDATIDTRSIDDVIRSGIDSLKTRLQDRSLGQDQRDDIARRLASIDTDEARLVLVSVLTDSGDPPGRLAVARALADAEPAAAFLNPLFALFDDAASRPLLEATSDALSRYKSDRSVVTRLISLTDASRSDAVRIAAIDALSTLSDRRAVERLVSLSSDASPSVASAALTGLAELSGEPIATSVAAVAWWQPRRELDEQSLREELLARRSARLDRVDRLARQTQLELRQQLVSQLQSAPREQRSALLEQQLGSTSGAVRAIAAEWVADLATTGEVPANIRARLPDLIADSHPEVRLFVARSLTQINDRAAFDPLVSQIAIEPDARVKAALVAAVDRIRDPRAVPLLTRLLDDPNPTVVLAATRAITTLGESIATTDARLAGALAERFARIFATRFQSGSSSPAREATLAAMVSLRQPSMINAYRQLLEPGANRPPEPQSIREIAVDGLGGVGVSGVGDIIIDVLAREESPEVRVRAVRAIGRISENFIHAQTLYQRLDESIEPSQRVRDETWRVLRDLFRFATRQQLEDLSTRLTADPNRRRDVLAALVEFDTRENDEEQAVDHLISLGEVNLQLGRYPDAIAAFDRSLPLARGRGGNVRIVESLTKLLIEAKLRAGDFRGAATFASQMLRDYGDEFQIIVAEPIKREVDRLDDDATQTQTIRQLLSEVLAMSPPLKGNTRDVLAATLAEIERKSLEQNHADQQPEVPALVSR